LVKLSSRQVPLCIAAQNQDVHLDIDTEGAWKLAQELVNSTAKDQFGFIDGVANTRRMMRDIRGRMYAVDFFLQPINDWLEDVDTQSVAGMIDKDLGKEKGADDVLGATIALYINDWNLGRKLEIINYDEVSGKAKITPLTDESSKALNNLRYTHTYRALIHELTHLMDPEEAEDPFAPETLSELTPDDMSRYYNQPRELRAHFQEILEEILNELEETDTPDSALEKSYQWKEMEPYLTEENKAAIRATVQRWFASVEL